MGAGSARAASSTTIRGASAQAAGGSWPASTTTERPSGPARAPGSARPLTPSRPTERWGAPPAPHQDQRPGDAALVGRAAHPTPGGLGRHRVDGDHLDRRGQDLGQEVGALGRGEQLQLGLVAGAGGDLDPQRPPARSGPDARHPPAVGAVEPDGDAEDGGEGPDGGLLLGVEAGELGVAGLGGALAVVAGHQRDALDLGVGEPDQPVAVADDVVGVLVVAVVADGQAHVGQEGGRLQVVPAVPVEAQARRQVVEQLQGQAGHPGRVLRVGVVGLGQVLHAAAPHVGDVVERPAPDPGQRVDEHPLPEGGLADGQLVDAEAIDHALQDEGSGRDDVEALGVQPVDVAERALPGRPGQVGGHAPHLVAGDPGTVPGAQRLVVTGRPPGQAHDLLDRPRRPDRDREAVAPDGRLERHQGGPDVATALLDVALRRAPSGEEPVGQAHRPQLQRTGREGLAALAQEELGAAAADVADEDALVVHREGGEDAEVDEPGLLHPGDDLDLDPGLGPGPVEEGVVVLGLPHRRGGHRPQLGRVGLGQVVVAPEGGHPPLHRLRGQVLHVARSLAQADLVLLPSDHLEAVVGVGPGHHEVDGVGADVDGGEHIGHGGEPTGPLGQRGPAARRGQSVRAWYCSTGRSRSAVVGVGSSGRSPPAPPAVHVARQ